jgi:ornithine carbamoyltransferase
MTRPRHFLDIWRLDAGSLRAILDDAKARKAARRGWGQARPDADAPLAGRTVAMIFQQNSTRTRFSFDAAIRQLGGANIISSGDDMQLGRGETIEDTARALSRMVDGVMMRVERHDDLERFALAATVPVINGLTGRTHPCQIMADLLTLEERFGALAGRTLAWVGDGNNVCASYIHAAPKFGYRLVVACPPPYHPDLVDLARAADEQGRVEITDDPYAAVEGADAVITDTWVSMGDTDHEERLEAFESYQVDDTLMDHAASGAVFLHCLPAHRGEEVTDAVIDGPRSLVWEAAENRVHAQKSVLAWCFGALG